MLGCYKILRMSRRLLALAALCGECTTVNADDINFRLQTYVGEPLSGIVRMQKEKKEVSSLPVPKSGQARMTGATCAPVITFTAFTHDRGYYLDSEEQSKSCVIGEIAFKFRKADFADMLNDLLRSNTAAIDSTSEATKKLHESLIAALDEGDFPTAAKNSLTLRDRIEKELGQSAATPFNLLYLDIAGSVISNGGPTLVFDAPQKKLVLSPMTTKNVKKFQEAFGLDANGAIDWKTVGKLPRYESNLVSHIERAMPKF